MDATVLAPNTQLSQMEGVAKGRTSKQSNDGVLKVDETIIKEEVRYKYSAAYVYVCVHSCICETAIQMYMYICIMLNHCKMLFPITL